MLHGKLKQVTEVIIEAGKAWSNDNASRMASSLAYYTLFSLGPLLLVTVSIAGIFYGEEAARGELANRLEFIVGPTAAQAIQGLFSQMASYGKNKLSTAIGIAVLLVGATGVFLELKSDFNTIWKVQPKKDGSTWSGILGYLLNRLLSFAMVLAVGFLLLVSLILSAVLSMLTEFFQHVYPLPSVLYHSLDVLLSYLLVGGLPTLIFRFLPDTKVLWRYAWKGALVTSLLFTAGKVLIGFYLGQSALSSTYGASASVVIILMWTYYSTLILFFGAEVTKVLQKRNAPETMPTPEGLPA